MSGDETFLKRWSRLKSEQRERTASPSAGVRSETESAVAARSTSSEAEEKKAMAELPPVESLTADSDFSAFLRKGVPEALKQQALRKLWASDPVIAGPDPLDFQNVDFARMVSEDVVTSAYEVGKGYADRLDGALRRDQPAPQAAGKDETQGEPREAEEETDEAGPAKSGPPART